MTKKVLIFSKKVLPLSNTFIATQGNNLPTYQPVYIGLRHNKNGKVLIQGREICVQEDHQMLPSLSRFMLDGFGFLGARWRTKLEAIGANVVHANFGKGGYYSAPIANKLQLPLVTTFHGSDITQNDRFSYNNRHRQVVFRNSAKILAVSKFIQSKLLQAGCPPEKLACHYTGLDTRLFKPGGHQSPGPTVLFVGRLIEQKGCQYLLQAMQIVQKHCPEASLLVAGSGVYEKKLIQLSGALHNVTFLGAQSSDQVRSLMSSAWVTCLPSIRLARGNEEGLSTVCLESQAVGTPVVGFNTGGVSESVAHEKTGLLSPEKDIRLLADNILMILQDSQLRLHLSRACVSRIQKEFCAITQGEKLESIYDCLC